MAEPAPKPKPRPVYGKPEKTNPVKTIVLWAIVVLGIAGIAWMIIASPREKALNCGSSSHSLIGFGSCTTD